MSQGSVPTEREASRNLNKKVYDAVVVHAGSIYVKRRHNHRRPANLPARFAFRHQKANQQKQTHSNKKDRKITRCCLHSGKKPLWKWKSHEGWRNEFSSLVRWASENESYSRTMRRNSVQPANIKGNSHRLHAFSQNTLSSSSPHLQYEAILRQVQMLYGVTGSARTQEPDTPDTRSDSQVGQRATVTWRKGPGTTTGPESDSGQPGEGAKRNNKREAERVKRQIHRYLSAISQAGPLGSLKCDPPKGNGTDHKKRLGTQQVRICEAWVQLTFQPRKLSLYILPKLETSMIEFLFEWLVTSTSKKCLEKNRHICQMSSWLNWYCGTLISQTDCRWWFDSLLVRK